MPTKAKITFDENCKDVDRLLNIHEDIAGNAPGRKYGVEVLNKSAIVLICAFWEAYVEDVVSESLDFIANKVTDTTKLPLDLRKIIAKTTKNNPHELAVWKLAGDGWKNVLHTNLLVVKNTYLGSWHSPKSTNVRELFAQSIGLPDMPSRWERSWLSSEKAVARLDYYVGLRGAIAHRGKASESVSKGHVAEFLGHGKELVAFTDHAVNEHLAVITGVPLF